MEAAVVSEIKKIRGDLRILTSLYSKLIDRILPEEEATAEDIKAVRESDEIADEEELFKVLNE